MTQVISFINMKGGVGKTTLAVHIAYGLAHYHRQNVLLVDVDPQFNASTYLMSEDAYLDHLNDSKKKTILDIFKHRPNIPITTVRQAVKSNASAKKPSLKSCTHRVVSTPGTLDLIPSTLNLMELQMSERGTENRLRNYIKEKCQGYDYVIIDCPPTISFFTQAAVLASDKYLVPLRPDPLAAIGLPLLERWLQDYTEDEGVDIKQVGIVFSYVRGPLPNSMKEVIDNLREDRGEHVFKNILSEATALAGSVEVHQPVFLFKPRSKISKQVINVIEEFFNRTGRGEA